jgi:hypothetical protein
MELNGFFKIAEGGFSLTVATFFNPSTKEIRREIIWDFDDPSRYETPEYVALREMDIDQTALAEYRRLNGVIVVGCTIKVVKGRKVPVGTVATVTDIKPWKDAFGRVQCTYAYLSNGMRTSIDNCTRLD